MSQLRLSARLYILALGLVALSLTILALTRSAVPDPERAALALAFTALMAASFLFQLPFRAKLELSLSSSAIFAAILLFEPGIAMLVAGTGTVAAYIIRRAEWDEMLFNGSQTALQAGAGGMVLASVNWDMDALLSARPQQLLMIPVAAGAMYLVNTISVAAIIGLQSGHSPLLVCRQLLATGGVERLLQLALGFLAAVVAVVQIWVLPLLLLPAFAIYRWLDTQRRSEDRYRALVEEAPEVIFPASALLGRREPLYWLTGAVSIVIAFGMLLAIHLPGGVPIDNPAMYALAVLVAGSGALLLVAPRWLTSRPYLFWPVAGSLYSIFYGAAVYFTGGLQSPFFVLYYFPLLLLGLAGGFRGAIVGPTVAGLLYVAACVTQADALGVDAPMLLSIRIASFYGMALFAAFLGDIVGQEARAAGRRARRIVGLNAINTRLGETFDFHDLVEQIPRQLCEQLGFERAVLYLLEGDALTAVSAHADAEPERMIRLLSHLREHPPALGSTRLEAEAVRTLRTVMSTDLAGDPRMDPAVAEIARSRCWAAAPMVARGQVIGVLAADHFLEECSITEEEVILLDTFARISALALMNSKLVVEAGRAEAFRRLDAVKSEFLATVSHELNTPLTLMKASTDVLLKDASSGMSRAQQRLIETVARNNQRLAAFVEELLQMAQLEEGRIELNRQLTDLRDLVGEVVQTLHPMVADRRQTLHLDLPDEPCLVHVDRHRMNQVVTNLLTNACKYTPREGTVRVRVEAQAESVTLEVRDSGPGIPPDELEHIFQKFYRLPGSDQRAKGTGLGLAITRSLVELHGSAIRVSSTPGDGARFWFSLRREGGHADAVREQGTPATAVNA